MLFFVLTCNLVFLKMSVLSSQHLYKSLVFSLHTSNNSLLLPVCTSVDLIYTCWGHIHSSRTLTVTSTSPPLAHMRGVGGGISWRGRNPQAWLNLISAASCPWDWSEMTFPSSHHPPPPDACRVWLAAEKGRGPLAGGSRWCLCWRYSGIQAPTFIWCYLDECHSVQQTIASAHHNTTLHPFKRDMSERGCKTETRGYAGGAAQDLWNITTWWQTLYQVLVMTWGQDNVLKSWVLSQKQLLCGFYVWMLVWAVIYKSNEESLTALFQEHGAACVICSAVVFSSCTGFHTTLHH